MKKQERFSPPAVGGTSLLVIFGVLVMAVFAMLSLTTALAEQRLSQRAAQSVTAYYEADNRAEEIFARLRQGEFPQGVEKEADIYTFCCEISDNQQLEVELKEEEGTWEVLRWQAVPSPVQMQETALPVWDGDTP